MARDRAGADDWVDTLCHNAARTWHAPVRTGRSDQGKEAKSCGGEYRGAHLGCSVLSTAVVELDVSKGDLVDCR